MAIVTYPLNGITYGAEDAETYLCTRTSGVYADEDCFDLTISDGMTIKISPGIAWVRNADYTGKSICMDTAQTLTLSIGDSKPRTDRIVLRFDQANNESVLDILEGTPSSNYPAPDVTQEESTYELGLYSIYVDAAATSLSAADITDTRLDEDVCGLMSDGVTKIPTATLQAQAEELIADLRAALEDVEGDLDYMLPSVYDPAGGARQVAFADELSEVEEAVANCESNIAALSNTISDVSSNVNTLTNTVSDVSSNVNTLTNTISDISSNVNTLTNTVDGYSNDISNTATLVATLQEAMEDAGINAEASYHENSYYPNTTVEIGRRATASGEYATAIGGFTSGAHYHATSLGYGSNCQGCYSIAISSSLANGNSSISIGYISNADGEGSIAVGAVSNALNSNAIAIGYYANANTNSVAAGVNAKAEASNAVAIGGYTTAANTGAVAIGTYANVSYLNGIAIGRNAFGAGSAVAIGSGTSCGGNSVTVGVNSTTSALRSIAIGSNVTVSGNGSIALGSNLNIGTSNTIQLGGANIATFNCAVELTTTSDIRDKTDITALENGATDFLLQISPILYVKNDRERYIDEDSLSDEEKEYHTKYGLCRYDTVAYLAGTKKDTCIRAGVSAQGVQEALMNVYGSANYAGIVKDNFSEYDENEIPDGVENKLSITYTEFIPFLIKAVQELSARITALEG